MADLNRDPCAELAKIEGQEFDLDALMDGLRRAGARENLSLLEENIALRNEAGIRFAARIASSDMKLVAVTTSVGGVPTAPEEFKTCVALAGEMGAYLGSGVLIARNVVLTAGHCEEDKLTDSVWVGRKAAHPEEGQPYKVAFHDRHGDYRGRPGLANDIGYLVLEKVVEEVEDEDLDPVASSREIEEAGCLIGVGFGTTAHEQWSGLGERRKVLLPRLREPIEVERGKKVVYDPDSEFLAGTPLYETVNAKNMCAGDSGGPIYVSTDDGLKLAAITSRPAERANFGCGGGSILVRVDKHEELIATAMKKGVEHLRRRS